MSKPLSGIKILDFSQFFAGPIATLLMSDMGAEIIKLENPPLGDATRYNTAIVGEKSTNFTTRNRGKKSVVMNLKDERQKAIFLEMVKTADAVVENFKPGTLEKYGVTYDLLKSINPAIVYTSVSGYGQTGPYRDHAAFDGAVQAESGIMSVTGEIGGRPLKCGAAIADATAGLIGCIGTLGALLDAKRTGLGRRVDVSMMDSMVTILENLVSSYMATGDIPASTANRMWTASPFRDFECKGGATVYIGVSTDTQFKSFCEIVNHPEWTQDPRFVTMANRAANADALEPLVEAVFREMDADTLCDEMQKRRLVYGRINNIADVVKHPQIEARNMLVDAVYPDGTSFKVPGCPIKMSDLEEKDSYETVPIGYNTFEILSQYVGEDTLHEIYDDVLTQCETAAYSKYHPNK